MLKKVIFLIIFAFFFDTQIFAQEKPVVIFDEGHGQAFLTSEKGVLHLSKFAEIFREIGFDIKTTKNIIQPDSINSAKAIIISGPFKPFSDQEIEALYDYVNNGGNLTVMLHIASPASKLFEKFGVKITNGAISETENFVTDKNLDFYVTNFQPHFLLDNLKSFAVYGSWGLLTNNTNVTIIAQSSTKSWIDKNKNGKPDDYESKAPFGIIATGFIGKGKFIFFADDAIFQNRFLNDGNITLGRNLANFLKE